MSDVDKLIENLSQKERKVRLKVAETLSDYVEFANLSENDCGKILQKLVICAAAEEDSEIQETTLNGIANALLRLNCKDLLDLRPLVQRIASLKDDCLLHAIDIIGLSRERKHVDSLLPFLKHRRADVREAAAIALEELKFDY
jgi:hypothetical protein